MSTNGYSQSKSQEQLVPTAWRVRPQGANVTYVVMYHLTLGSASSVDGFDDLFDFMANEFADEVERGNTYPQEPPGGARYTREEFKAYYFAADVILGLYVSAEQLRSLAIDVTGLREDEQTEVNCHIDAVRGGRSWGHCVAGFYYIKPNYPGRSSHICNAGFVVPYASRGRGYARILARSYLYYAPRLGYQSSVFNLVYVNNIASIRLWEALGFTKAGRIPRAGRLRRNDGQGEEYVDAWIFYKSFFEDTGDYQRD